MSTVRFGVLISGSGTNLQALIDARGLGQLDGELALVVSNNKSAHGLIRAAAAGIPTRYVSHRAFPSRETFEMELVDQLLSFEVDWVVLAGFMRLLTSTFLSAFPGRVVNIHPALLPAFPGTDAQKQALEYGVRIAGCTVHLVDEGTDTGPILAQTAVAVHPDDDLEHLKGRILAEEHRLYPRVLQQIATEQLVVEGRRAAFVRHGEVADGKGR